MIMEHSYSRPGHGVAVTMFARCETACVQRQTIKAGLMVPGWAQLSATAGES